MERLNDHYLFFKIKLMYTVLDKLYQVIHMPGNVILYKWDDGVTVKSLSIILRYYYVYYYGIIVGNF